MEPETILTVPADARGATTDCDLLPSAPQNSTISKLFTNDKAVAHPKCDGAKSGRPFLSADVALALDDSIQRSRARMHHDAPYELLIPLTRESATAL